MLKNSFLGLFLIFSIHSVHAQHIRLGVFVNPVFSWMSPDASHMESNGSRVGIDFGLLYEKYFAAHYAFSSGVSLHSMGGDIIYRTGKTLKTSEGSQSLGDNSEVDYKLQYLHVPLGIKLKTSELGYFTYFADLGLDPMVNVKARANVSSSAYNATGVGVGDEISFLYMAYHLSAGVEYKIVGNTSLVGGINYMNGFTNVTDDGSVRNVMHCIEIKLGILF